MLIKINFGEFYYLKMTGSLKLTNYLQTKGI